MQPYEYYNSNQVSQFARIYFCFLWEVRIFKETQNGMKTKVNQKARVNSMKTILQERKAQKLDLGKNFLLEGEEAAMEIGLAFGYFHPCIGNFGPLAGGGGLQKNNFKINRTKLLYIERTTAKSTIL